MERYGRNNEGRGRGQRPARGGERFSGERRERARGGEQAERSRSGQQGRRPAGGEDRRRTGEGERFGSSESRGRARGGELFGVENRGRSYGASRFDGETRRKLEERSREKASSGAASTRDTEEQDSFRIEGRNAVVEALRSGRTIDRIYILDGLNDGAIQTVKREAAKHGVPVRYVDKERLDLMSETGKHQGVIANAAAYAYSDIETMFQKAGEKGEAPFLILLDDIEDPHNLGAIIRTANIVGAHGVIIPKDRACGLTATVVKASAGALNYTPVAKVTNLGNTIEELKKRGMWFVCADMDGTPMGELSMTGPIGLVIGAEGNGVSRLVKEKCDMTAAIPMRGEITSLNASVAAGVLAYEILRQRDAAKKA